MVQQIIVCYFIEQDIIKLLSKASKRGRHSISTAGSCLSGTQRCRNLGKADESCGLPEALTGTVIVVLVGYTVTPLTGLIRSCNYTMIDE